MDVACNDLIRQRIIQEIKNKETDLRERYINLKNADNNEEITSELNEYEKHYKPIRHEKQQQIGVLHKIAEHLDKLTTNTNSLNEQATLLKKDQKIILEKLATLKRELEEISPN